MEAHYATTKIREGRNRTARAGALEARIRALVEAENIDKFLEIDVESGDYQVDKSEIAASKRVKARRPNSRRFLMRIGYEAAYSLGSRIWVVKMRDGEADMQTELGTEMPREEVFRRAQEWYETKIRAQVEAGNKGKFLVIDILTGDYEVDKSEVAALDRLIARHPQGRRFMMRIGYRTAYSLGGGMVET